MDLPKPATAYTAARNTAVTLPNDDGDFERASRGFIASIPTGRIDSVEGRMVVDVNRYNFIRENKRSPDTVNPSLWRHARLNAHHGLFEVADGVWQVRGYDISNITFIKGTLGWVVIDPLTTEATARASYELITSHLGQRPVTAVIYTHSHVDHFGGVLGVTTQAEVDAGRCRVIAPVGFLQETVGENVIAGPAMSRRAAYQFGPMLSPGPTGHVDCGLGNSIPLGAPGLIAPTEDITATGEELLVDGVRVVFQLTPETEAPAEMNFFFPDSGWLCMAENCSHTMHNLVPIRGALVRNSLKWSKYIHEAMELFGAEAKILFTSHNWPRWGGEDLMGFLTLQRDLYRWMHDQTMRLANKGYTATEIAATLTLPEEFLANDHTRGYYGDLVHNSKAVYQRYLSWYDANPANLNKYQPSEAGARYVALAGGADALLEKARAAYEEGDYRWVVELVNHLVFADPTNVAGRHLQADALEQLGYQAESATFRNAYLMGAQELRTVRMKSEDLGGVSTSINWDFTDIKEQWVSGISNRTLYYTRTHPSSSSAAASSSSSSSSTTINTTVRTTRTTLIDVISRSTTLPDQIQAGNIVIEGDAAALRSIFGNVDIFETAFAIVEP
eukprot:gene29490-38593_t